VIQFTLLYVTIYLEKWHKETEIRKKYTVCVSTKLMYIWMYWILIIGKWYATNTIQMQTWTPVDNLIFQCWNFLVPNIPSCVQFDVKASLSSMFNTSMNNNIPLYCQGWDEEIVTNSPITVFLQESHQESKTNKNHYMHILETWMRKLSLRYNYIM
jgi:hypothetical protein